MLRFSYTSLIDLYNRRLIEGEKFIPTIKVVNATWDYFQLMRQLNLTLNNSEQNKFWHMQDQTLPKGLQSIHPRTPFHKECRIFSKLIKEFMDYLIHYEALALKNDDFCLMMISTSITVVEDLVVVNTEDKELEKILREVVIADDFSYEFNTETNGLLLTEKNDRYDWHII